MTNVLVGCAGWSLPKRHALEFPGSGTHLERYARRLDVTEINSSFHRPHRPQTYERWAASVPTGFRFSVKVPREITHVRRLRATDALLESFLAAAGGLGEKLGALLVQLPPSSGFDRGIAHAFFSSVRSRFGGPIALEARHPGWFVQDAGILLESFGVSTVAADPAPVPRAARPGGNRRLAYFRWHGSPRTYYSDYSDERLRELQEAALAASAEGAEVWCLFDNTALGAAIPNALALHDGLARGAWPGDPASTVWSSPGGF